MTPAGLPHSDTPGSQLGCQLPRAYRRLQRPSSALDAKASTMCPSQLVSQTLNKNNKRHTPPPAHSQPAAAHYKKIKQQPHTPNPPHNAGATGPSCCQMLASTIHMSNTTPTNPHPPAPDRKKEEGGTEEQPTPER